MISLRKGTGKDVFNSFVNGTFPVPSNPAEKIVEGIRDLYGTGCDEAREMRTGVGKPLPIVAMGHFPTAGGRTVDGDGVRDLYIFSLARVRTDVFLLVSTTSLRVTSIFPRP